ncbi:hypothetical protein [Nocardia sp. NPDC051570]|uniref:hypothetical protein n=1 Tax=Nocardia sp. NPDC051570 TaxID=3364324 RepID=UPI0037AF8A62
MDVGQSTATDLLGRAHAGTFRMEPGKGREVADIYIRFADFVADQIDEAKRLHALTGFGGFASAGELSKGFEGKAVEMTAALTSMRIAALRMAEAYLIAGGMVEAADDLNRRVINATANATGGDRRP